LSKTFIPFFYKKFSYPTKKPDIIISTGGNCSNLNVWFKYLYNAKNILNGNLRGLKCFHFDIVTTVIDLGCKNQIVLDVAPTTIKLCPKKEENLYTLLIGGDGSGYRYDEEFFIKLIDFVKNISKKENIKWLITTSRRTDKEYEELLEKNLKDISEEFVAYHKNPKPVVREFLCKAKKVFVTEESASMISEAIASGKKVYTLKPKQVAYDKKYTPVLEKFEKEKRICRIDLDNIKCSEFNLLKEDVYKLIAKKLKEKLW
jgi:mitochondrial fission protein ELM1